MHRFFFCLFLVVRDRSHGAMRSGMDSKMREDLEQQLVRNHRHCRLIDQRSNHRHRRDRALHPSRSISMAIRTPCERVGNPKRWRYEALSHTRHESKQASNKNQSMKEQRTAPPSLNQPLPHSHEPLLDHLLLLVLVLVLVLVREVDTMIDEREQDSCWATHLRERVRERPWLISRSRLHTTYQSFLHQDLWLIDWLVGWLIDWEWRWPWRRAWRRGAG